MNLLRYDGSPAEESVVQVLTAPRRTLIFTPEHTPFGVNNYCRRYNRHVSGFELEDGIQAIIDFEERAIRVSPDVIDLFWDMDKIMPENYFVLHGTPQEVLDAFVGKRYKIIR